MKESSISIEESPTETPEEIVNEVWESSEGANRIPSGEDSGELIEEVTHLITEGKGITVNRETGEVTMKFKLPGF